MLVFFGFTHCPDECPMGLAQTTQALETLGSHAKEVAPLFITVDPERDTPEVMKAFLHHFHPTFTGLTGIKEQVAMRSSGSIGRECRYGQEPEE